MAVTDKPVDPGPAAQVRCEWHRWVSTHQPNFPVYWIRQCSICEYYDPDDMAKEIAKVASTCTHAALSAENERLIVEVARLRAGESAPDDVRPADCWPTPAQFIRQWNELNAAERLDEAAQIINTREREFSARIRGVVEGR